MCNVGMEKITPLLVAIFIAVLGVGAGVGYVGYKLNEVDKYLMSIEKYSSDAASSADNASYSAKRACENTNRDSVFSCG